MRVKRIMALLLASALVMGGMLTADASEIGQNAANESSTEENTDTAAEEPVDSAGEDDADTVTDAAESAADNKNDVTDTVIDNTADDSAAVEDESGLTEIDGVLYINGIPVDYDDPYCLKYIENYYSNGIATASVSTTDYYTNWNGKTYYHKESAAKGKDISVGMDVSKWDGTITWSKVADAGIEFAIVRLGYTGTSTGSLNLDPTYKTNMTNAQAAGVHLGIYYYSQAITVAEAKKEAQYVLDNLGGYSLDLPIMFDYEYYSGGRLTSSTPNKATKTEICNAFCQTIEDAGYVAGVYANKSMFTSDLNANNIESNGHRIWLAHYTSNGYATDYSATSYEFWQCSSTESVAGISTYVDLDWWYHYPGVTTVSADIINLSGTWTYCVNGEPDYTYTGLAKNSNGWWYVEDGIVEFDETGFVHNGFEWVYAENSKVGYDQEGMYEGEVDGVKGTWYVSGGVAQTSINGLMDKSVDGNWYYLDYGRVNETTTVAKNKNGWYYVNNGIVDFTYTDFAENSNGWWYIEKGKVTFSTTGVVSGTVNNIYGKWLVEESKLTTYNSGLMNKSVGGKWYYIDDYGKVADTTTTVAKNKNGWYYVKDGVVDFTYTGFAENDNGWWYVEKGKVTFNTNSVIKDTYGAIDGDTSSWWYVVGSKVQTGTATYTGLANYKNTNGWWYVDDGKVNFGHKGVEKNKNGWWYVTGGKVDFTYTGFAENKNGWWYIESGKVTFSTNSVIKDTHGAIDGDTSSWWYVVGSKVQTGTAAYTGLANYKNSNGWWYVVDGKVDFDHSGVEKNKNGWWYVKGGKVIFSYTGIAGNSNGWWYIKNGKVDFSYNGTVKVSGETYTVKNGKVDK